jgi:hypothetical protein
MEKILPFAGSQIVVPKPQNWSFATHGSNPLDPYDPLDRQIIKGLQAAD